MSAGLRPEGLQAATFAICRPPPPVPVARINLLQTCPRSFGRCASAEVGQEFQSREPAAFMLGAEEGIERTLPVKGTGFERGKAPLTPFLEKWN